MRPKSIPFLFAVILTALTFLCLPFLLIAGESPTSGGGTAPWEKPAVSSIQWWLPVIVPMLVAGLKAIWPSIPKVLLPVLCPLLGIAANYISSFAGVAFDPASAAALGALGVFLREVVDQGKKGLVPNPNLAPAFAVLLILFGTLAAQAQSQPANLTARDTIIANDQLFRAGEVQIDAFGTGRIEELTNLSETKKGGGGAVNYFPWRAAGFGLEASGAGWRGVFIDSTAVSLIGRFPVESLRLAPEIKLGADYEWRPRDWSVFAGVGLDYRISRHVALAGELRGVRPIAGAEGEHAVGLVKFRVVF